VGKKLYKTYLKEQLKHWRNKLAKSDNPYKRKHATQMVENFKILVKKYSVK